MKKIFKKIGFLLGSASLIVACSEFEEINVDPTAASGSQVQVEYFIDNSIVGAQQNPHISERVFELYWTDAGRMQVVGTLSEGYHSDGWTGEYYKYVSGWLNNANNAIKIADEQLEAGTSKVYTGNLKQIARIWRAYLMSEMSDNFGPVPVNGFQGVNPDYNSVEDVYTYVLAELKEATSLIDEGITNDGLANWDPAYGYDYTKWIQYGNSLRMRLAMRLSEVAPSLAQAEFEDAARGAVYISTLDDTFQVAENNGWDDITGVMTRQWWDHFLSATQNNLMIGLGGVPSADQVSADMQGSIKPANYMGLKFDDHFTTLTNDPSAGFWFDGLHNSIDPRAYDAYIVPGDFDNANYNKYPSWSPNWTSVTERDLIIGDADNDENGETNDISIEATYTWNAPVGGTWAEKGSNNKVRSWGGTIPRLAHKYRNGENKRVFFGPWESYFLIAEAAVRGWDVPLSGQAAYEEGISQSFAYNGVSSHIAAYLSSENYNRVGTSVSWNHTMEPANTVTMDYIDGYTGVAGTYEFKYPENTIYEGGSVKNDLLTKIITQKFIAQTPWLPLETWNDHRRLGLPFFENPAIENLIDNSPNLTLGNYMTNSVNVFPQRLKYPSGLTNSYPQGYEQAINHLGGDDSVFTPLWWAKH